MKYFVNPFIGIWYPKLCPSCSAHLPSGDVPICVGCQYKLPRTDFHRQADNPVIAHFMGRVDVRLGAAMVYFFKGSAVQELMHRLKYKGERAIGHGLGRLYGGALRAEALWNDVDVLVPVPLHPLKERLRGYNQSEVFARGVCDGMLKPYADALRRVVMTDSQTKKSRVERFGNVEHAFEVADGAHIANKHVLLVDDVITTGATLEACVQVMQQHPTPPRAVSILTLAYAMQ
jgi:ComF family protein